MASAANPGTTMELAKARETITAAVFFVNMIIILLFFSVHVVSCDTFYTDSSLTLLQLLKILCCAIGKVPEIPPHSPHKRA